MTRTTDPLTSMAQSMCVCVGGGEEVTGVVVNMSALGSEVVKIP